MNNIKEGDQMKQLTQRQFIKEFNDKTRPQFNKQLFERTNEDSVRELEKVVRSCERHNKFYTIEVYDFYVITDYVEIYKRLREHELSRIKANNVKARMSIEEKYDSIQLNDSEIFLVVIIYHTKVNTIDEKTGKYPEEYFEVLIEVPKIVDKYYIKLYGNFYLPIYQIVDGSTYNNSGSASKHPNVTLKTMFLATRIYRYQDTIKCTKEFGPDNLNVTYYETRIFGKPVPIMKYLLAKYGFIDTLDRLKIKGIIVSDKDLKDENYYTIKKHGVYVSAIRYLYDNDIPTQSMVYTIVHSIEKNTTANDIYNQNFWLASLGGHFGAPTSDKGFEILESLYCIYDLSTKDSMHLPIEDRQDVFHVIIWIIREFPNLRGKDNLDLSTKRIRMAEYQAALYAMKISNSIHRASTYGKNISLADIKKFIYTQPEFLIKRILKDTIKNYRNSVNDLDSFDALKFTFKGLSGLGDGSSIPSNYRKVDISYIGRLDMDSSSHTDPGMSGTICPLADIKDHSFSDYMEPNTWRQDTDEMIREYMTTFGLKQIMTLQKELGVPNAQEKEELLTENLDMMKEMFRPMYIVESRMNETEE